MKSSPTKTEWFFLGGSFLVFLIALYFVLWPKLKDNFLPKPQPELETIAPTVSPEEHEIIANIKSHIVEIFSDRVVPEKITVNQYDQVIFDNKTGQQISIKLSGWEDSISLGKEENLTEPFRKEGEFEVEISGLPQDLKAMVAVTSYTLPINEN